MKSVPLFERFVKTYTQERMSAFFRKRLHEFIDSAKIQIVSSSSVRVYCVYDSYLQKRPPFKSDARKQRSTEFPDAFVLEAIKNWCEKNNARTYALSGDSDWKIYCEENGRRLFCDYKNLIHIEDLSEFLDAVNRNERSLSNLADFVDTIIDINQENITLRALDILKSVEFTSDVSEIGRSLIEINDKGILEVKIVKREILSMDRESASIRLDLEMKVIIEYTTYIFSEQHTDTDRFHKKYLTHAAVLVDLRYKEGVPDNFEIASLSLPGSIHIIFSDGKDISLKDWRKTLPVIVVGVHNGNITDDGSGFEQFQNIDEALITYPDLNIDGSTSKFTNPMGHPLSGQLRFETWKAYDLYST